MNAVPRTRVDALTDGIYAIVMTILVLEIRLPAHAQYTDAAGIVRALGELSTEFVAYAISFFVLALFWRGEAANRVRHDEMVSTHLGLWIVHLFFITCIPISTGIVGKYGQFAPAVWLYAANMGLVAAAAWARAESEPANAEPRQQRGTRIRLGVLIASALLSVALSFINPAHAMWAYLLNTASPIVVASLERWRPAQPV